MCVHNQVFCEYADQGHVLIIVLIQLVQCFTVSQKTTLV